MHQLQAIKSKPSNEPSARRDAQLPTAPVSEHGRWTELQRGIGNQAVSRILQRRAAATAAFRSIFPQRPNAGGNLVLQRKCACGGTSPGSSGECEECSKKNITGLQTKLRISEPGDVYEQEADRVAGQVMAMPTHPSVSSVPPRIQRLAGHAIEQPATALASVDRALAGPGRPLEPALRQEMEQRLGHDFSGVRVHSDAAAEQSAQDLDAHAYTVGQNLVFATGLFAPRTPDGQRLLAHELTHVVQQGAAPASAPIVQRQPAPHGPPLTRAEEIRLSLTSPGEIAVTLNPPMLTLYNFAIDRSTLKKEHIAALRTIAFLSNQFAGTVKLAASGHADSTGEEKINIPLSGDRVAGVQALLQGATGLPVFVAWFSDFLPAATNETVEGRSRNRRVDISLDVSGGGPEPPEPCRGPKLLLCACERSPEICRLCIDHPALCFCALFFEACLACIASFTKLADCYCSLFPCKDEPTEKKRKACPDKVDLPWGEQRIDPRKTGDNLIFPFDMQVTFLQEPADKSPYCDCNCGEYRQYVAGYFKRDDAKGVLKNHDHWLTTKTKLKPYPDFQEDGQPMRTTATRQEHYGHRYRTDDARSILKAAATRLLASNDPNDRFVDPNRQDGCTYHGHDEPGFKAKPNEEVHFHLWFRGGPVDACNGDREIGDWHAWEVVCHRGPHPPRLVNRPFIVRSGLPQNPKEGQELTLEVAFPDQPPGCYGRIPVTIIGVSDITVTIWTRNMDPVQIAPDACPDIWILPYQAVTIVR
jgi:outer membrane protein OmpA-like peptidoglycan-associated protein